jgi:hypothetical protein
MTLRQLLVEWKQSARRGDVDMGSPSDIDLSFEWGCAGLGVLMLQQGYLAFTKAFHHKAGIVLRIIEGSHGHRLLPRGGGAAAAGGGGGGGGGGDAGGAAAAAGAGAAGAAAGAAGLLVVHQRSPAVGAHSRQEAAAAAWDLAGDNEGAVAMGLHEHASACDASGSDCDSSSDSTEDNGHPEDSQLPSNFRAVVAEMLEQAKKTAISDLTRLDGMDDAVHTQQLALITGACTVEGVRLIAATLRARHAPQ